MKTPISANLRRFPRGAFHKKFEFCKKLTALLLAFLFIVGNSRLVFADDAAFADSATSSISDSTTSSGDSSSTVASPNTDQSSAVNPDNSATPGPSSDSGSAVSSPSVASLDPNSKDQNLAPTAPLSEVTDNTNTDINSPTIPSTDATDKSSNVTPMTSTGLGPNPLTTPDDTTPQKSVLSVKPDDSTGALTYQYPIKVPPGRLGLHPNLAFSYNSQNGDNSSIFGYGWSINIPYIQRINIHGVDQLYSSFDFTSSLSGDLEPISSTSTSPVNFTARVDNGDFLSYSFDYANNKWTVKDKTGLTYVFGNATGERQDDPNNSSHVYKWYISSVTDTHGNFISYTYYKDQGQIYPQTVTYTSDGSNTGIYTVNFTRNSSARADNLLNFSTGFSVQSNYVISQVQVDYQSTAIRTYTLAYSAGANSVRSLLSSITESGYDPSSNSTVTLPATTFNYSQNSTGSWWTLNSNWSVPVYLDNIRTRVADVNGDGLADIIVSYHEQGNSDPSRNGTFSKVYLNTGSGWSYDSNWTVPVLFIDINDQSGTATINQAEFVDLNGDGKADVLTSTGFGNSTKVYINNGHGWDLTSWNNPPLLYPNSNGGPAYQMGELNGDGMPDYMNASLNIPGSGSASSALFTIDGISGWGLNSVFNTTSTPLAFVDRGDGTGFDMGTRLIDANGDGLADLMRSEYFDNATSINVTYLNKGNGGWQSNSGLGSPQVFAYYYHSGPSVTSSNQPVMDINGDGLPDIFDPCDLGTGVGFYNISSGQWTTCLTTNDSHTLGGWGGFGVSLGDVNGDGMPDYITTPCNSGGCDFYNNAYSSKVYMNTAGKPDLLTTVTSSQGGTATIVYKASGQYTNSDGSLANPNLPISVYTAQSITVTDPVANVSQATTYWYGDGRYYYASPTDRKFAGFGKMTATDSAGNVTKTYYHTSFGTDSSHGEYQDNYWKIGKPYRIESYDNNNNLYKKTINKWDSATSTVNSLIGFVKLTQTMEEDYDSLSTHKDKAENYTYNNSTGNQTQKVEYGQVTGNDDGSFTDTGTDDFTTNISYASATGSSILGEPSDVTVVDHNSNKVKESRYYYDSQVLGVMGSYGNQTKEEDWKSGSSYINTQKTYNSYGLVTQTQDANGHQTNYTYDSYNLHPATQTNPLSQQTQYTYDYANGQVMQTTDVNNHNFQNSYDGLGRVLEQKQPDIASPSTLVIKSSFTYTDTQSAVSVQQTNYLSATSTANSYTYLDGLGRKLQQRNQTEGTNFSTKDFAYNNRGLLDKESLPYFSASSGKTSPTNNSYLYTSYTYDALGRKISITNAIGTATNSYNNWKTTTTDLRGVTKDFYNDAYNNLIEVDEHAMGMVATTVQVSELYGSSLFNDSSLVSYYRMEGNGNDSKGGNNGSPTNVTFGTSYGKYGQGGSFNGSTSKVDATISSGLSGSFTLNCWFKPQAYVNGGILGSWNIGGTAYWAYLVQYPNGTFGANLFDGRWPAGNPYISSTVTYTLGTWYMLTLVRDTSTGKLYLYVNGGNQVNTTDTTTGSSYSAFTFGYRKNDNTEYINGYLDDVSVFSRALTADEIYGLFNPHTETIQTPGASVTYSTQYSYNGLNNLTKITDASGNVRNFTYDGLGRRLTAEDLHASGDSTYGSYSYAYDDNGNLTQKVDPKSQTINYTYDNINRPLTEDYTGQLGTEVNYTYDSCTNGVGLLCSSVNSSATTTESYNPLGRISNETKTISGTNYQTSYTYDRQGNQLTITNPDNSSVKYTYDDSGLLQSVQRKEQTDSSYTDVVTNFDYSPTKQVTEIDYANGTITTNNYDNTKLYRLVHKVTITPSGSYSRSQSSIMLNQQPENNEQPTEIITQPILSSPTSTPGVASGTPWGIASTTISTNFSATSTTSTLPLIETTTTPFSMSTQPSGLSLNGIYNSVASGISKAISFVAQQFGVKTAYASGPVELYNSPLFYDNNLVSYWRLEGNSNDSKGGNNGSNTSVSFDSNYGKFGQGALVNSSTGSINFGNPSNLQISGTVSVGMWVKVTGTLPTATHSVFVAKGGYPAGYNGSWGFVRNHDGHDLAFIVLNGSNQAADVSIPDSAYNDGNWHYFVGVYVPSTSLKIYLDGLLYSQKTTGIPSSLSTSYDVSIGHNSNNCSSCFAFTQGDIDEVYVFNRALTDDEIFGLYSSSGGSNIQDFSYAYDANGNITQIADASNTDTAKTVTYSYDDLNRLTQASSTEAVYGGNYTYSYTYDPLGNILSRTENSSTTNYTYATSTSGYYNPDAAIHIGNATSTYDNNGNLLTDDTRTNTWDYRNQLAQVVMNNATSTYAYDYTGQRVKQTAGGVTTVYPSKYYNTNGTTPTKNIFLPDGTLIATVVGTGTSATVSYIHSDHLGGMNVATDNSGAVAELTDYLPYGGIRNDEQNGLNSQRKFIGQEHDTDTGLEYLNARYYNAIIGKFTGQDPMTRDNPEKFLGDPQQLNYYSYARNNPILLMDPNGLFNISTGEIEKGDTLTGITSQLNTKYGTNLTVPLVAATNNISNPNEIKAGGFIILPRSGFFLVFNNQTLQAVDSTYGISYSDLKWNAVSGNVKTGENKIPEGSWSVDPKDTQYWKDYGIVNKTLSTVSGLTENLPWVGFKMGSWPGGVIAWGHARTELSNDDTGEQKTGYYIHGGWYPGSAGCIDLTGDNDSFHQWFTQSWGKPINVVVAY